MTLVPTKVLASPIIKIDEEYLFKLLTSEGDSVYSRLSSLKCRARRATMQGNRASLKPKEVLTAGTGDQDTNIFIFVADTIGICLQTHPKETPKTEKTCKAERANWLVSYKVSSKISRDLLNRSAGG